LSKVIRTTLGEVADFTNGGAWNQTEYVDRGIPVVRVSDIDDETVHLKGCKYLSPSSRDKYHKHLLHTGDVVVATVGSHPTQPGSVVGRAAKVPASASGSLLNQNAVCLRPLNGRIEANYLRYLAVSQYFRNFIIAHSRGSANQVRMAISSLREMPICLPIIERQRDIGQILSAYDDLIENNIRRIEILDEMAQMIYRESFVNFRFPGHEKVGSVNSEIGLVPKGWNIHKVSDLIKRLPSGRVYTEKDVMEFGEIPVVDQSRKAVLGFHDQSPDHNASPNNPVAMFGDHTCKMRLMIVPFSVGPNVVPFVAGLKLPIIYVFFAVRDLVSTSEYKRHWNSLTNKTVLVADFEPARQFSEIVSPMLELSNNLLDQNLNLRRQRDLLLPRLISGDIAAEKLEFGATAKSI
jgi:type I restriction enzyme S subunit